MLFVTNRFPRQSIKTRRGRRFDFDLDNNAGSNSIFFCRRENQGEYTEIGNVAFLNGLKESAYRQILIYIHGYSNLPEDVFAGAQELQRLCDRKKRREALVVPVVWPCDNDLGAVQDYWDDQKAADLSAFAFARALEKFIAWRNSQRHNPDAAQCLKRINVLAHSMGNRVLRGTLENWQRYDLANGVPLMFRNAFLVAADIVNESLQKGQSGEPICHASRNVAVYYAADDLALRASKTVNLANGIASRRLGHTGPEGMAVMPSNVYAIDCDDVNTILDPECGHAYFLSGTRAGVPGPVFEHIFQAILSGRVFPDDPLRRMALIREL